MSNAAPGPSPDSRSAPGDPWSDELDELLAEPPEGRRRWPAAVGFTAAVALTATVGGRFGARPPTRRWYDQLRKPPFQPPPQAFGPVWTTLYPMIGYAGYRTYLAPNSRARQRALVAWAVQMAANAAWAPTFFGARRPRAALVILATQLASTASYTTLVASVDRPAAGLMAPYLAWTGFAGVLNAEIVHRNPS